jgi:hypothetical protein
MANITRSWKRFLAVGCSHGHLADQKLLRGVLRFKDRWKPHKVVHLGDAIDLACLREGAIGTADDAVNPESDLQDGLAFIERLEPSVWHLGNHEARLVRLMSSPRAMVAALAARVYADLESQAERLRCDLVPYNFQDGWRTPFGSDCLTGHGYMANEMALRDHAEAICAGPANKVIIAHLHRVSQHEGRRRDHPTGYCVGWMGDPQLAVYAAHRRATTSWSRGFAWGEYCDNETQVWLAKETISGAIRLPV